MDEPIKVVKKGRKRVVPVIFEEPPEADMLQIIYSKQRIQGNWTYTPKISIQLLIFLALERVNLYPLITFHRFSLNEVERAFDIVGKKVKKIVKMQFIF